MPGLLVGSVTNVWLRSDAPELPPLPSVDAPRMAPALLDGDLPVGLVPLELASEFLRRFGRGRKKKGTRVRNANKAFVCPRWTRSRRGKESVEGPADDPSRSPRVAHAAVVWVRRPRGASSTKEQQLSSPEPTPAQPPSRARARGMVFARRAQRTLTILAFVIGWTMVTLFRSGCLRPRYGLPTHSVLCSPCLPSTLCGPRRRRGQCGR